MFRVTAARIRSEQTYTSKAPELRELLPLHLHHVDTKSLTFDTGPILLMPALFIRLSPFQLSLSLTIDDSGGILNDVWSLSREQVLFRNYLLRREKDVCISILCAR